MTTAQCQFQNGCGWHGLPHGNTQIRIQIMLKLCPFCGEKAYTYQSSGTDLWYVECLSDNCCRFSDGRDSEEEVISTWNTRSDLPNKHTEYKIGAAVSHGQKVCTKCHVSFDGEHICSTQNPDIRLKVTTICPGSATMGGKEKPSKTSGKG